MWRLLYPLARWTRARHYLSSHWSKAKTRAVVNRRRRAVMGCGHAIANASVLGHCRACDFEA